MFNEKSRSSLVHRLVFGTPRFDIVPYGIIHGLVNPSCDYDMKSGLSNHARQCEIGMPRRISWTGQEQLDQKIVQSRYLV